ncbi:VacJ family lipoprotein [Marinospirillum sp.]|uniref:MlaA family lipoprotein n=1 Tax=Marinospirillum sp. TaxID=2183934 RepID=UPI00286FBB35|nr:VacJ family lipoprotein [Marinospirillum sp.]MDR9467187.1 VacJ family lipoprotein [Marinospirillum sp.]
MKQVLWLVLLLALAGCSSQSQLPEKNSADPFAEDGGGQHPRDPYEDWNRKVFAFNETVDGWVIKPVAQGYKAATPRFLRTGVRNFFANLYEVSQITNNLLQAKPAAAGKDTLRFALNSTLGMVGFLDVATPMGLQRSQEDFGQTLNVWGVPQGPYFVWPFLGGETLSHTSWLFYDLLTHPLTLVESASVEYSLWSLYWLQQRTDLLDAESLISGDRYSFIRDAYLQRRTYLINDGQVGSDPFLDDDFDDMDFDDAFSD